MQIPCSTNPRPVKSLILQETNFAGHNPQVMSYVEEVLGCAINKKASCTADAMQMAQAPFVNPSEEIDAPLTNCLNIVFNDELPTDDTIIFLKKCADNGGANSQCLLGKIYQEGRGVPKDNRLALHYFCLAAKPEDNLYARSCYIKLLSNECVDDLNSEHINNLSDYCFGGRDGEADYLFGKICLEGKGRVPKNEEQAFIFFLSASKKDHPGAVKECGLLFLNGRKETADYWDEQFVKKCLQPHIEAGSAKAKYLLAVAYRFYRDRTEKVQLLSEALEGGIAEALPVLVKELCRYGIESHVKPQLIEKYLKLAADGFPTNAKAAFQLAQIYSRREWSWGQIYPKSDAKNYYELAAAAGYKPAEFGLMKLRDDPWAACFIGLCYLNGSAEHNIGIDAEKAHHYLLSATKGGHSVACYLLSDLWSGQSKQMPITEERRQSCIQHVDYYRNLAIKMECNVAILENIVERHEEGACLAAAKLHQLHLLGDKDIQLPINLVKAQQYERLSHPKYATLSALSRIGTDKFTTGDLQNITSYFNLADGHFTVAALRDFPPLSTAELEVLVDLRPATSTDFITFFNLLRLPYSDGLFAMFEVLCKDNKKIMEFVEQVKNINLIRDKAIQGEMRCGQFCLIEQQGGVLITDTKTNQSIHIDKIIDEIIFNASTFNVSTFRSMLPGKKDQPPVLEISDTNVRRENVRLFARVCFEDMKDREPLMCRVLVDSSGKGMMVYRGDSRGPFELFARYGGLGTKIPTGDGLNPELSFAGDLHQARVYGRNGENIKKGSNLSVPKEYVCTSTDMHHAKDFTSLESNARYIYEIDTSKLHGAVVQELAYHPHYGAFRDELTSTDGLIQQADHENEVLILGGIPLGYGCIKQVWYADSNRGPLIKINYNDNFMLSGLELDALNEVGPPTFTKASFQAKDRPGTPGKIIIPYAKYDQPFDLTERTLNGLFSDANTVSINFPYQALDGSDSMSVNLVKNIGVLYRQNHNGTHSIRQVKIFEALLGGIKAYGTTGAKSIVNNLSKEEVLSLKMAAFFLRAGRVDEASSMTGGAPDVYKERSAQLFELYARQTNLPKAVIDWTIKLISDSGLPDHVPKKYIDTNDVKSVMMFDLLSQTHNLDLYRCFGSTLMHGIEVTVDSTLQKYMEKTGDCINFLGNLKLYAKDLITATGATPDGELSYENKDYYECSNNVNLCFERVNFVKKPGLGAMQPVKKIVL